LYFFGKKKLCSVWRRGLLPLLSVLFQFVVLLAGGEFLALPRCVFFAAMRVFVFGRAVCRDVPNNNHNNNKLHPGGRVAGVCDPGESCGPIGCRGS